MFISIQFKVFLISLETSLAHVLFENVLFNFQLAGDFPDIVMLLISNFIPLQSQNIVCIISIHLSLLGCVSWPRVLAILVTNSSKLEKVCILLWLDELLYKYPLNKLVEVLLFRSTLPLLIFSPFVITTTEKRVLKSVTIVLGLSIFTCCSTSYPMLCCQVHAHLGLDLSTRLFITMKYFLNP